MGLLVVGSLGAGLTAVHLTHVLHPGETVSTLVYGVVIPLALALALLGSIPVLWRRFGADRRILRIAMWTVIGGVVIASAAVLTVLYQAGEGVQMRDPLYIVANAMTGGAVIGEIVGLYDTRQLIARKHESQARDRAGDLDRQLSILYRVFRHDLRNRASVIRGRADILSEECDHEDDHVTEICKQVDELVELGQRMNTIDSVVRDESDRTVLDLPAVIRREVEQVADEAAVDIDLPEGQSIRAHPLVADAIGEVVENVIEHTDQETPSLEVSHAYERWNGTDYLVVELADSGPGIPEAEVRVLERGYETQLEHLSGLGLWFVHWVVTESGGEISIGENDPRGSVIRLRFETVDEDG